MSIANDYEISTRLLVHEVLCNYSCLTSFVSDPLVSPKIHPFTVPESLQRGDRLSLTCSVFKGNKPIEITWSRSPLPLPSDPNSTASSSSSSPLPPAVKPVQIDDFTSMLAVADLDLSHNGAYTCRAENAAGSAAHTAVVRVNGKRTNENARLLLPSFQSPRPSSPSPRPRSSRRASVLGSSADWPGRTRRSASPGSRTE